MNPAPLFAAVLLAAGLPRVSDVDGKLIGPRRDHRIVSIAPALTEILFAIGAGSSLVAASDFCDYPPAVSRLPRIGSLNTMNLEKMVVLRPTVVMSAEGPHDRFRTVARLTGARFFVARDGGIEAILANIRDLGSLTAREREAEKLARSISSKVRALRRAGSGPRPPRVFYLVWDDPLMTAGAGSYLDELLTLAGGENIGRGLAGLYPIMSWERLLAHPPDIVVGPDNLRRQVEDLGRRVKARETALVDRNLLSRPGPRVVQALEALQAALRPAGNKPLKNTK